MWFYVDKQRQQRGPVTVDELKALLARDDITKRTHLWQEGRADWVRLETLAAELGISIATPPPTPAPTMAIPAMSAPAQAPVQPAFAPPPSMPVSAPPAAVPMAPPMAAPPMSAPQQAPAFPSFPQAPAPGFPAPGGYSVPTYAAPAAGSGNAKKFLGTFVACVVFLWFAYAKLGHLIPGMGRDAKAELLYVIDEFEPARAEIRKLYTEKSECPGTALPISAQAVRFDYFYGTFGDAKECAIETTYPADFKLESLAGTRVFFLLRDGEWLCGMSAADAVRPGICEKIDATRN